MKSVKEWMGNRRVGKTCKGNVDGKDNRVGMERDMVECMVRVGVEVDFRGTDGDDEVEVQQVVVVEGREYPVVFGDGLLVRSTEVGSVVLG